MFHYAFLCMFFEFKMLCLILGKIGLLFSNIPKQNIIFAIFTYLDVKYGSDLLDLLKSASKILQEMESLWVLFLIQID